jgi:hypothetical protein
MPKDIIKFNISVVSNNFLKIFCYDAIMRDNDWLAHQLQVLRNDYFSDVLVSNRLFVRFGRPSRTRLGSIIARPLPDHALPVTYITVKALFREETVPEYVVHATLAHEMAHYAHGFHSPLPRKYPHPHRGNVVSKELAARGALHLIEQQEAWLKSDYTNLIRHHFLYARKKHF